MPHNIIDIRTLARKVWRIVSFVRKVAEGGDWRVKSRGTEHLYNCKSCFRISDCFIRVF